MSSKAFPTASTVPFPYDQPYNVQADLMSAILTSLRQCHENDLSAAPSTDNAGSASSAVQKRRAPILMVESPTGTGKSLSLACAAMAWLRYCEEEDLKEVETRLKDAGDGSAATEAVSSSGPKRKKKYDWLDSWQPESNGNGATVPPGTSCNNASSQHQQHDQKMLIRTYAISNRAALNKELNTIRARLEKLTNVAALSNSGNSTKENSNTSNYERAFRENILKSGISRALVLERKRNRAGLKDKGGVKRKRVEAKKEEEDFMLDDYHSDEEEKKSSILDDSDSEDDCNLASLNTQQSNGKGPQNDNLSAKAMLHGANLDGSGYRNDPEKNAHTKLYGASDSITSAVGNVTPGSGFRKIVYAARTHSQLSQFVGELKRTHWGKDVKVVALGSRSVLCSNDTVLYKGGNKSKGRRSEAEITEICLDMQKSKRKDSSSTTHDKANKASSKCPLLESSEAVSTLAMHSLVRPSDIEDVAALGKAGNTCSYYASREAIAAAEVVVLPYNTLLSENARQSVGLSLKNALVVVDEAHNLPEALRGISSCQLSLPVIEAAVAQLGAYTAKYSGRLAGRNLYYLGQIRRVLVAMVKFLRKPSTGKLEEKDSSSGGKKEMLAAVDLMFRLKLDNLNLFTLLRYIHKSRISQKLLGFINHTGLSKEEDVADSETLEGGQQKPFMSRHISALSIVETFLQRLSCTSREGKVIVEWLADELAPGNRDPMFRFVQIHSASLLDNIVEEAHAIILAGGTLRPFSHVAAELFGQNQDVMKAASDGEAETCRKYDLAAPSSGTSSSRPSSLVHITTQLTTFTCGHVIPPHNVTTAYLASGPSGRKLDFRHSSRSSNDTIDELGRALLNLCNIVPSGFVVFLPSYNYESVLFQRWRSTGMLSQIHAKKPIHREPKSSRDLDAALSRYSSEASSSKTGAILFSVMGGKMSEGINFANEMARTVLVVGLPYPDITDPVLVEKMQSLDREYHRTGVGITGQSYYQNLCMRAVNQSVGRAIRHANDYAAIILADFRYTSDVRIWKGLPVWMRSQMPDQTNSTFGKVLTNVRSFFVER